MSSAPVFLGTFCEGRVAISAANTATDGSGTLQSLTWLGTGGTAPGTDWQLNEIWVTETSSGGVGDLADCVLNVYTTDAAGANALLLDTIDLANPAASSTTQGGAGAGVSGPIAQRVYASQRFPAGCDLKFTLTVAPTTGAAVVHVFAERA